MIRLETNLPGFFNELCEVIRLFLGAVEIRQDEGDELIVHRHDEVEGLWVERFSAQGHEVCHAAPCVRDVRGILDIWAVQGKTRCAPRLRRVLPENLRRKPVLKRQAPFKH